jgi:hypothetical protein
MHLAVAGVAIPELKGCNCCKFQDTGIPVQRLKMMAEGFSFVSSLTATT